MYVPERSPAAHQVAAKQNSSFTGCYVYVEGGSDCRFWKNHFDNKSVKIVACNGWEKVVETVNEKLDDTTTCIGIIDSDFRKLIDYEFKLPDNIFITDDHDIEMMIFHTSAYRRVLNNYDKVDHLSDFENENGNILDYVIEEANKIGLLKLINQRDNLGMKLKSKRKEDEYPDMPKYENFMDSNLKINSAHDMISSLITWSINHKAKPNKNNEEIETLYNDEDIHQYDSWQLSNGHDVSYVMAILLHKKKIYGRKIDVNALEDNLRMAPSTEEMKHSQLFRDLKSWEQKNGVKIF